MMMVDDGGGRGVKNGRKSDDVINGRPLFQLPCLSLHLFMCVCFCVSKNYLQFLQSCHIMSLIKVA